MKTVEEFQLKTQRIRAFLETQNREALLINRQENFAWLTGGGENRVNTTTDYGAADLLVTREDVFLITDNKRPDILVRR